MQIGILKLLILLLDLKIVLTPKFYIFLDRRLQSSLAYNRIFAHALLQFLGARGDDNLKWRMLFISVMISTILVLVTTSTHKTTCTQFGEH